LPQLTEEEEKKLDEIVNRFIDSDIGKLTGREADKAVAEFKALGPEAIFALTRGVNRAAKIESSCPALLIAKKISAQVRTTRDVELLEFLRENVGAGVSASRHQSVLRQLKFECTLRKNAVSTQIATLRPNPPTMTRNLEARSIDDLKQLALIARGDPLKPVLRELEGRSGERALDVLATVAASREIDRQLLGEEALANYLAKQNDAYLKEKLKDDRPRVRAGTIKVIADKRLRLGGELIEALLDDAPEVRKAARQALVKLSGGKDFGPDLDDSLGRRDEAARKWRAWWKDQGGK
jgi:hypothetical protein